MTFYASFDTKIDNETDMRKFLYDFLCDCECMVRLPDGLVFSLIDGTVFELKIRDLSNVECYQDFIYFEFGRSLDRDKVAEIIPFKSIVKINVLPDTKL